VTCKHLHDLTSSTESAGFGIDREGTFSHACGIMYEVTGTHAVDETKLQRALEVFKRTLPACRERQ
jgi:hypothetical protein